MSTPSNAYYNDIITCRMIKEEGQNLEEAIVKCKDMTETLLSLRKCVHSINSDCSCDPVMVMF